MAVLHRTPQQRLPGHTGPSRGSQVVLGLLALLGTLAIVVGVPVLLLSTVGVPWPSGGPSLSWLTRPVTISTVLAVLAAIVWLAWAHFCVCLVIEAISQRRHRISPRVPGGAVGTQSLARRAVASIALLASTAGVGVTTAAAATAAPAQQTVTQVAVSHDAPAAGQAHDESAGRLPDEADLTNATRQQERAGYTTYYEVHPPTGRNYDTMWDIAQRYLGDGRRYKEIWELNKGRIQPDGRELRNPDLIYPAWVLRMPSDSRGPGLKVVKGTPGANEAAPTSTGLEGAVAPQGGAVVGTPGATAAESGGLAGTGPILGVVGGLALAGAALGLRRRRNGASFGELWQRVRTRHDDRPDPTTPGPDGPGGGAFLANSDTGTAVWLDGALRAWGGPVVPAPTSVAVGSSGVVVAFPTEPGRVPSGWTSYDESTWTLSRETVLAGRGPAPLPGLVTVGRRADGSTALVDLESVPGVIALDGDDAVARGVALSLAIDTATHPWADRRAVTMVGFAEDLTGVGAGVIRHEVDLGRVLESLENTARHQRSLCRRSDAQTAAEARLVDPQGWTYQLVVCSGLPDVDELGRLRALAADPQVSLAVVVIGAVTDAALRLGAQPDGRLLAPASGIEVVAQSLTPAAVRRVVAEYELPASAEGVTLGELAELLRTEQQSVGDAVATLGVLGPVRLDADGDVEPERRELLTELACFVALHPGGVHVNRIAGAIWPRGVTDDVRDATLGQLGDWLGRTAEDQPALRQDAGVWSLAPGAVRLDWDQFRLRLNQAADRGAEREQLLAGALNLVRGTAFDGVPNGRYGWLEPLGTRDDIALAVGLTAQALAEAARHRGDEAAASAALTRGLTLLPANEDLWRARLLLADREGGREAVVPVAEEMYAALREHGSPVGARPETDSLVDELLPGWRPRVA